MKFLDRISIKRRMMLAFSLLVGFFSVFAVFSLMEMTALADLTASLYDHPFRVSRAALRAQVGVVRMHRMMKDESLSASELELRDMMAAVRDEEQAVQENLRRVSQWILGDKGRRMAEETLAAFEGWKPVRMEMLRRIRAGNKQAAFEFTRGKAGDYAELLEERIAALSDYAGRKADGFMAEARALENRIQRNTLLAILFVAVCVVLIGWLLISSIHQNINRLKGAMSEITETGVLKPASVEGHHEIAEMAFHFNLLLDKLRNRMWIQEGLNRLNREIPGVPDLQELADRSIRYVSRYVEACVGALFLHDPEAGHCDLRATYAFVERRYLSARFGPGEGIVGQVAVEGKPILLTNIAREEAVGNTGTASEPPRAIYAFPLLYNGDLLGVMEVGAFNDIDPVQREFLDAAGQVVSTALYTADQNRRIRNLLESTRNANQALVEKTEALNHANEELQIQSEEVKAQAAELKARQAELLRKQEQAAMADRLKSEFLSNMSHELRTPLNSVLALSQLMINRGVGKDLDQDRQYLSVIERNGRHLLNLINDLLDLSKIESGRLDLHPEPIDVDRLLSGVMDTIRPLAGEKGVGVSVGVGDGVALTADADKLRQILLNLASNAVKFTETGEIEVTAAAVDDAVEFTVRDTGIGIEEADLDYIFDAFRQVDGSTTRRHEGTGLGLAICRNLAVFMGGDIRAESTPGRGSVFTLTLPMEPLPDGETRLSPSFPEEPSPSRPRSRGPRPAVPGDPARRTVLVIDDDESVCGLIRDHLRSAGYRVATTTSGREGVRMARELRPFAVTLDILMPDMDGWEVLRRLKEAAETRDTPVIVISVSQDRDTGFALGAAGYVLKPVDRHILLTEIEKVAAHHPVRRVLVVDDDPVAREQVSVLLSEYDYRVETAPDGNTAIRQALDHPPDVMILDLMMPEMDGFAVLDRVRRESALRELPVLVLTAKDLNWGERMRLKAAVNRTIQKGTYDKAELLEGIESALARLSREAGDDAVRPDGPLVLVVEDNDVAALQIRTALEESGYGVRRAGGGGEALEKLADGPPDAVILDLMMPEMDGFQLLDRIRADREGGGMPVLVLTAKELTEAEKARLKDQRVHGIVYKGAADREELVNAVRAMFPEPAVPESVRTGPILVVEDNADNRLTLAAILEAHGVEYRMVEDGPQALAAVREISPGMVLMDVQLPGLSGLDAARRIKSAPASADIPVVALTARAMQGDREAILAAGCDDYISKPIEAETLIAVVRKWTQAAPST